METEGLASRISIEHFYSSMALCHMHIIVIKISLYQDNDIEVISYTVDKPVTKTMSWLLG